MDNLEKKLKEDWEHLSVPDQKVLDAIKSGMEQAPKKRIPYKKIGLTLSTIAAVFLLYIYQQTESENNSKMLTQQEPFSQEKTAQNEAKSEAYAPSQNTMQKKEALPSTEQINEETANKVTQEFSIEMESKQYDQSLATIEKQIKASNGLITTSYSYNNESEVDKNESIMTQDNRFIRITVKIPREQIDSFIEEISAAGKILVKQEDGSDITAEYKDIETHIKNLKIQEERLQKLLGEADSLSDMLQIESRLSEVGYTLETYQNQLKNFDQEINYTTVHLVLTDVAANHNQTSLVGRIQDGWTEMTHELKNTAGNLLVWTIVYSPYLLAFGVISWLVYRKVKKKKQSKSKPPV
ncbi:DUF4349 domain-containing protein [Isobaculum melis]|uniref:DUF4349 domain-containing protein n=1 Tax=Isobaculum melis TaxID=142588 RepID=A0A1H9RQF7_9LACT|nr:DUF4349 domain-containing protein [Isobaculum melis]SER75012.1 protein of unknown function [Isobaculum melis]